MKVKQQTINRQDTFLVRVTDADTNDSKEQNVVRIINGNTFFYKDDLVMFAQAYQIKCRKKERMSFFNIWTRNGILAITIYVRYEGVFVVCFTDFLGG
jgi:hypothetical protein